MRKSELQDLMRALRRVIAKQTKASERDAYIERLIEKEDARRLLRGKAS